MRQYTSHWYIYSMQDETPRERSPKAPRINVEEALRFIKALHGKIGRSAVKSEVAMTAMGYKGESGASLTTMAALNMYGLIERKQGAVIVSQISMKILFPTNEEMKKQALRDAVMSARIFAHIHEKFHDCSIDVLTSNLVHEGFSPDAAKNAATVYKENVTIAELDQKDYNPPETQAKAQEPKDEQRVPEQRDEVESDTPRPPANNKGKMLATYSIPLGANEAKLEFTGSELTGDDFQALIEFVEFAKKQFERRKKFEKFVEAVKDVPITPMEGESYPKPDSE